MHWIKWKKMLSAVLITALLSHSYAQAATIGNIKCEIISGEKIVIHYQITGKGIYTINMQVSLDEGKTFSIKPLALTGDVGNGISTGVGKRIEWDVFKDVKKLSGNMVILLEASKERDKPINKWLILAGLILLSGSIAAMGGGEKGKTTSVTPTVITYGSIHINVTFPE